MPPPARPSSRRSSGSATRSSGVAARPGGSRRPSAAPGSRGSLRSRRGRAGVSTSTSSGASGTTSWPDLPLLADTSAWARAGHAEIRDAWTDALTDGRILTCPPVALELLYSTRDADSFDELAAGLDALRSVPLTESAGRAARAAMRELAARTPLAHRLPPFDYLVGAIAQEGGVAVLHYDEHFDRLATVLQFDSVWIAPRGSIP